MIEFKYKMYQLKVKESINKNNLNKKLNNEDSKKNSYINISKKILTIDNNIEYRLNNNIFNPTNNSSLNDWHKRLECRINSLIIN